ncbi:hypothetical protein [Streptomyces odontomachi]|uniref:hypothetical protein n=1 Tax=Streptomyces odontomachi TaxID=2944940 RepID=UPI00210AE32B|nr:hypothetical protein [Streptomyces sp. ODS25]
MYAIHIRLAVPERDPLDIHDIARELSGTPDCLLQHVYAPGSRGNGHRGVLYVAGSSVVAAGEGVLAAVRRAIGGRRMQADLVTSTDPRTVGLCDATVRVTHLPVTAKADQA